ncbi:MAG: hypothetical protein ACUVWA_13540 [Candidatus Oleimicrobiaceae bacterium]
MQRTPSANGPELLLADEPTGNLDSTTAQQIPQLLANLHRNEGETVILVTHDEPVTRRSAHRIFRLSYGRLVGEEVGQSTCTTWCGRPGGTGDAIGCAAPSAAKESLLASVR